MLIAGDVYRPAAIDQLLILGKQVANSYHQYVNAVKDNICLFNVEICCGPFPGNFILSLIPNIRNNCLYNCLS